MKKTKFASYLSKDITEGCKFCVKGEKLVLFITGLCSRNCIYCPLSEKRKNKDKIWANERECQDIKDLIEEAYESNAKGAGITGGDPLLKFDRTIEYAKALKKEFGKKFHIHIYLPTKLVTKEKLIELRKYIDEIRFHPDFFIDRKEYERDAEIIRTASEIFGKGNTGIEVPVFPERKQEILEFIKKIKNSISFVNLNELELGDSNFDYITKKYKLHENGYVVADSSNAGIWLVNEIDKLKLNIKVHFCTAELKNWHQYKNRLLKHRILPFGKRTKDGTVIYFVIQSESYKEFMRLQKQFQKNKKVYIDVKKERIILSPLIIKKLIKEYVIKRVEEYPTYDKNEVETEEI